MFERLLDKDNQPTAEELARCCGENRDSFASLNSWLTARCGTAQEIRFPYGKKYGWCITHRRGKKLVCDVFAEAGAFTVMLRLSDEQFMSVYDELAEYAKKYIDSRYPCGNGGWIHYRVTSGEHMRDIELLLSVKCR